MRVSSIEIVSRDGHCQLQAWVESEAAFDSALWFEPFLLWHRFPEWCLPVLRDDRADPFLAALLLPAMMAGERLHLPEPVSPLLLRRSWDIQAIYLTFDRRARRIDIETPAQTPAFGEPTSQAGLFFSLGVDSFYSLLKHERSAMLGERISHLIAIHGIDVLPGRRSTEFNPDLRRNSERVAVETGARFLPVVTNIRRSTETLVGWPLSHGSALASIGLALEGLLGRILIAATTTYDQLYPWGTHPALDPLWSTEALSVVHDGCEISRLDKVTFIAGSDLVLESLRVCPGYTAAYNCGHCIKCLPTMIDLLNLGVLERSPVFPAAIDADALRDMLRIHRGGLNVENYRSRLRLLKASGGPEEIRTVLAEYLATEDSEAPPEP